MSFDEKLNELETRLSELHTLNGHAPKPLDPTDDCDADLEAGTAILEQRHLRLAAPNEEPWREKLVMKSVFVAARKEWIQLPMACPSNVALYLRYHKAWEGVLAYDELKETVVCKRPPPRSLVLDEPDRKPGDWSDVDAAATRSWFAMLPFGQAFQPSREAIDDAVIQVAAADRFNPIADYLNSLKWDGVARLPALLGDYFAVERSIYACEVGKRWMISAVARALQPGCQVDCVLILEGTTGAGKTSGLRALCPSPEWYSETPVTLGDRHGYEALRGKWIYVIDELDSVYRSAHTKTLNVITATEDNYLRPYGRSYQRFPRRCVFAGTTERTDWVRESTGIRRWWPVRVAGQVDREAIVRDRDQLWAEAVERYRAGEAWYANTPELVAICREQQGQRVEETEAADALQDEIQSWLSRQTVQRVKISQVLTGLGIDVSRWDRATQMRTSKALQTIGWIKRTNGRERYYVSPTLSDDDR